jgi:hypothetical protein
MRRSFLSRFSMVVATLFCLAVSTLPVRAEEQPPKETPAAEPAAPGDKTATDKPVDIAPLFLRVVRNDAGEATFLETAVVGYVPAEGSDKDKAPPDLQVDLIGVVHIGDKAYYDALNARFEEYDALLYELVAPEGTEVKKSEERGANMHPVAALQYGLKSMLDLEFQLDNIDYGKANFVHADMSPEEFAASMKRKGESFTQMYFRMLGASIAQQSAGGNSPGNLQTMLALFSSDRTWKMKRLFAEQFEGSGGAMSAFEGVDGSTIIAERNKKAFEVLRAQIDGGKRRIGVFYGAGHLADMEKRLEEDFSLRREKEEWLPAWSLQPPK